MTSSGIQLCLTCKVNEAEWDSEPPRPSYSSTCSRCKTLFGYRPQMQDLHIHENTAVLLRPMFDSEGTLTGWCCYSQRERHACTYVQPLVARFIAQPSRCTGSEWWDVIDLQTAMVLTRGKGAPELTEAAARAWAAELCGLKIVEKSGLFHVIGRDGRDYGRGANREQAEGLLAWTAAELTDERRG